MTRALALALCLAFPFALAACGGGGGKPPPSKTLYQYWNAPDYTLYLRNDGRKPSFRWCFTLEGEPDISDYSKTKEELSDVSYRWDERSRNFKSGDTVCNGEFFPGGTTVTHIQTKENEFALHYSTWDRDIVSHTGDILYRASIDNADIDKYILQRATVLGLLGGFKYGVFDNIEERRQVDESQVIGSTSATDTSEVGIVFPTLYRTQYGVAFGDSETTETVKRTGKTIEVQRQHTVRFYHDKPNTDAYFDLAITAKSVFYRDFAKHLSGGDFEIIDSAPPADYYWGAEGELVSSP